MAEQPEFYVEVILDHSDSYSPENRFPRLNWNVPGGFSSGGMYSTVAQRRAKLGRFACHRVDAVGIDIPLIEPKVELEVDLAVRILEAFTSGTVASEDIAALRAAIRRAP